jgi:transposase-like protein
MGAVTMQDWHAEAVRLRDEEGKSERAIAKELGRAPSTVHAALSAHPQNGNGHHEEERPPDGAPVERQRREEERPPAEPTPGQQTIDGGEVQPEIGEVRVDGTVQLGLIDFGGKKPQTATVTLAGGQFDLAEGQAYSKGERLFFAGQAQVQAITGRDKLDTKTMIATSAVQHHAARIFELHVGDEEQILVGLFRQLVAADRQNAITIADAFVREANGGV